MAGKLLLISDLEGCIKQTAAGPQSTLLCSDEFFGALRQFLGNPANKIAFLGDYFDQGPYVVDSVNSIMDLHRDFGERVIIIVGNRDINKLRLAYEMRDEPQVVGEKQWPIWANFYTELSKNPQYAAIDRLKLILTKSMGAVWPPQLDDSLSPLEAGFLLVRTFSQTASRFFADHETLEATIMSKAKFSRFVENCRALFTAAKIVHKEETFNTLLSHAGGAESYMLHTPAYYESILTSFTGTMTYYDKIEQVRIALQSAPVPEQRLTDFIEETYNAPFRTCVQQHLLSEQAGPDPIFFLLQGLGLKPNPNEHFVSFIQSCDIQSCKGPQGPMLPDYNEFLHNLATNSGIQVIASGHSPHCVPVPLIYKRQDFPKILFVANDTSNGYRPAQISTIEQIPLSYISKTETGDIVAGVFSLPGTTEHTFKGTDDVFGPLIGEWNLASAPEFRYTTYISYSNGKQLFFPAREHKAPPGIFMPAAMKGGFKRKTKRNRKRNSRNNLKKSYRGGIGNRVAGL